MSTENLSEFFQTDLLEGEKILWTGYPQITLFQYLWVETKTRVTAIIMILGFSVLFSLLIAEKDNRSPLEILAFAVLSAIIALLLFGVAALMTWRRKYIEFSSVRYAITDQRILMKSRSGITSVPIGSIPSLSKSDVSDTIGTITSYAPGWRRTFWLYRIKDADSVYKMITELQANQPTQ